MTWQLLRDHLRADAEAWLEERILHDPDHELRAKLAANREQVLQRMTDLAELISLRRAVAEHGKRKRKPKVARGGMQLN
jgi:hypothetical protein